MFSDGRRQTKAPLIRGPQIKKQANEQRGLRKAPLIRGVGGLRKAPLIRGVGGLRKAPHALGALKHEQRGFLRTGKFISNRYKTSVSVFIMKKRVFLLFIAFSAALAAAFWLWKQERPDRAGSPGRIYWFIPDGVRADPKLFTLFQWAEEGKLPHIKRLMDEGVSGYSIPDFPSHTPTNFASLLTGSSPKVHGIADGPMRLEGRPLRRPSVGGFSSTAKKAPPLWTIMERAGKRALLLSVPGSTPPELKGEGAVTIRGRWGGWGFDTHKVIFESPQKFSGRKQYADSFKLFFIGSKLTRKALPFLKSGPASGGPHRGGPARPSPASGGARGGAPPADSQAPAEGGSPSLKFLLKAHGAAIEAAVEGGPSGYDRMVFFLGKEPFALSPGEWSGPLPVSLKFKGLEVPSHVKIKVISLNAEDGAFRVRVLFHNLNRFITEPSFAAEEMTNRLGFMTDFADNWPPQLIYESADKETFREEAFMSLAFHKAAVGFLFQKYQPDLFIHSVYTPNQMLESRWWMGDMEASDPVRQKRAYEDIIEMYQGLDAIVGEAFKILGPEDLIVFSSDHGVCPLKTLIRLNNLFAKKGWLRFHIDPETGETEIDLPNTKAVYLKMAHVYVHPKGLGGNWKRGSGPEYERLREAVRQEILSLNKEIASLKGKEGPLPVSRVVPNEKAEEVLNLPASRSGDLVLEVNPPYFWFEGVSEDLKVFGPALTSGFKQTIDPSKHACIRTPFLIWGKGIKAGVKLDRLIRHRDQAPTILKAFHLKPPGFMEGRVIEEALKNP